MIRLSALWIYVIGFSIYASKDWYKSLCALILLTAVVEHPDMPKSLFGIQGLSPWNILLAAVLVGWFNARRQEGLRWDLQPKIAAMLLLYLAVVVIGFGRMMVDAELLYEREFSKASLISEFFINTIKWVIPGLLLYDGCRSRQRFFMGITSVLGVYFLLAVQVIKWMPFTSALSGGSLSARSLKVLLNEVGYHRVNISAMLAGASWGIFAARPLGTTPRLRAAILLAACAAMYAQALTAGRAGYVTWAAVGVILCTLKWRKYLVVFPIAAITVLTLVPGVAERMLEGFTPESWDPNRHAIGQVGGEAGVDVYTVTAGRMLIWPYVIEKIGEAPLVGYGRQAMVRTGLVDFLYKNLGEEFAHPHNAYLELLFDNGLVGFAIVVPFYLLIVWRSFSLFLDSRNPIFYAMGGATAAFVLALLVAAMGSQTFYPREGWMGMWCLFGLMLRVHADRARWDAQQGSAAPGMTVRPARVTPIAARVQARVRRPAAARRQDTAAPESFVFEAPASRDGLPARNRVTTGAPGASDAQSHRPSMTYRPRAAAGGARRSR